MRHFERKLFFGGTNGAGEAACFSRFTVLLEYMKRHGLKRVAYADNDVAVTSNITAVDSALFSDKEMALMWFPPLVSGHLSMFGRDGLEDFVGFFESLFTDRVWQGHPGVVQDMQVPLPPLALPSHSFLPIAKLLDESSGETCMHVPYTSSNYLSTPRPSPPRSLLFTAVLMVRNRSVLMDLSSPKRLQRL